MSDTTDIPVSDTIEVQATERSADGVAAAPAALNAKRVRRRLDQIAAITAPGRFRRQRHALATRLLQQIADGDIKNPRAVARAFVEAYPEAPAAAAGEADEA